MRFRTISAVAALIGVAVITAQVVGGPFIVEKSYDGKLAKTAFVLRDTFAVTALAWSGDGKYLASGSMQANLVHVWSVKDRKIVKEIELNTTPSYFHTVSWSPDGRYLAVCDGWEGLRVFNSNDWQEAHKFERAKVGGCHQSAFSSDGQRLALLNGAVRILDVLSWKELRVFDVKATDPGSIIHTISFVPGTHTVLIGGSAFVSVERDNQTIQREAGVLWTLDEIGSTPVPRVQVYRPYSVNGGAGVVISLSARRDGSQFATGTQTGSGTGRDVTRQSVQILSFPSGKLIGAPLDNQPFGAQEGLSYTADGKFLVVGHKERATKAIHLIETSGATVVDVVHVSGPVYDIACDPTQPRFAASFGDQIAAWTITRPR